eukprot:COSAG02_NODE_14662_length_1250_cov_1.452650_3_plen_113_part_01
MLSMIDSQQLLTYDNITGPGSFSDVNSTSVTALHAHAPLTTLLPSSLQMDMLEVCNEGLSVAAWRSQMAIWSIMTSPLILGNNPLNMTKECLDIIGNEEIIALNQDANVQRAK